MNSSTNKQIHDFAYFDEYYAVPMLKQIVLCMSFIKGCYLVNSIKCNVKIYNLLCSYFYLLQAGNQLFIGDGSRRSSFLSLFPSLAFLPLPFPHPFPSPPFPASTPEIQLEGLGSTVSSLSGIRAVPGRQTHFGAIEGQNFANHVNKLACSQHMPINIMLRCAVGCPGTLLDPLWLWACVISR